MTIRNIQQSDNETLAHLIKSVFEDYGAPLVNTEYDDPHTLTMFETFRSPESEYFVVEDEGEVTKRERRALLQVGISIFQAQETRDMLLLT